MDILLTQETSFRLVVFFGLLALLLWLEHRRPARNFERLPQRRSANFSILLVDIVLVRLIPGLVAVGAAYWALSQDLGLLNWLELPAWLAIALTIILLDLAIWGQHVAFHFVPFLWRFHAVHHSDPAFDVTTGLRFHPIEIIISLAYKMAIIAALGCPPEAVILFEILLNAASMFEHSNIHLPERWDRRLRKLIVTPSMHRVHHSVVMRETNSNYGFHLSIWDRLFGTYIASAQNGEQHITFGLDEYPHYREQKGGLLDLLKQPF